MNDTAPTYFKTVVCPLCNSQNFSILFSKRVVYSFAFDNTPITFTVVKCTDCTLQYMNPMLTDVALQKLYTKAYLDVLNIYYMDSLLKNMRLVSCRSKMDYILKKTRLLAGNVLDFGCGNSEFIKENSARFDKWVFYGFDFNSNVGTTLKNVWVAPNISLTTIPTDFFDIVTMFEVIEHFTELHHTFDQISSYIKKGGYIYIETGNLNSLISNIKKENHFYYDIYHTIYFSRKTIRTLLKMHGFTIVAISDDVFNGDLFCFKETHNPYLLIKGIAYWSLSKIKLHNFSITGGMAVLARKN